MRFLFALIFSISFSLPNRVIAHEGQAPSRCVSIPVYGSDPLYQREGYIGCRIGYSTRRVDPANPLKLNIYISEADCEAKKWCEDQFVEIEVSWSTDRRTDPSLLVTGEGSGTIRVIRNGHPDFSHQAELTTNDIDGSHTFKLFRHGLKTVAVEGSFTVMNSILTHPDPRVIGFQMGAYMNGKNEGIRVPEGAKKVEANLWIDKFLNNHKPKSTDATFEELKKDLDPENLKRREIWERDWEKRVNKVRQPTYHPPQP